MSLYTKLNIPDHGPAPFLRLDELQFADFTADQIETLVPTLRGATFTEHDNWVSMPDSTGRWAQTIAGIPEGQRYAILTTVLPDGSRVESFIGTQNIWVSDSPAVPNAPGSQRMQRIPSPAAITSVWM